VARRTNRIFSGFVVGKLLDALFVGVVTYFALLIMGMPFAPLIATLVGVTNIIPFFGPFIGALPSTLLLLVENPMDALYFVIFILVLQVVDGNIVENRILGEKLGISDFWVLVAILVFGGIFGFMGMLLGVPIFAVVYSLIVDSVNRRLAKKRLPLNTELYHDIQDVYDLPTTPVSRVRHPEEPGYDRNVEAEDDYEA
jgi:predicted PurR-regulated permease PerM